MEIYINDRRRKEITTMSVYDYYNKTEKKKMYYFITRYVSWDGRIKQKKQRGFYTKRECKEKEQEFLNSMKRNTDISFIGLYDFYIKHCEEVECLKKTTMSTKKNIFEKHILDYFRDKNMSEIDKIMVSRFFQELTENHIDETGEDYTESFKKTIKNQLSSLFNFGIQYYGIEKNLCHGLNVGSRNSRVYEIWEEDDFKKFIKEFDDDIMYKTIFCLLWSSGMREGELLGLQLRDFDFKNNTVSIRRNLQFVDGEKIVSTTKTESSRRTIDLGQNTMNLVKKYSECFYDLNEKDFLFDTNRSTLSRRLHDGCEKSGVKKIRIHDIRHSHITYLIDKGHDVKNVSVRVGHKNVETTLNVYTHCTNKIQKKMSNDIDECLNDVV